MEKKVCLKCGSEENVDPTEYMNCPIRDIMEKNDWCYYCSFWQNLYNENKDNPRWIRVDGSSWILGEEVKKVGTGWGLGCGGRRLYFEKTEGNKKILLTSNNCWHQGDIPDVFKDIMPDNARQLTREEYNELYNNKINQIMNMKKNKNEVDCRGYIMSRNCEVRNFHTGKQMIIKKGQLIISLNNLLYSTIDGRLFKIEGPCVLLHVLFRSF
jgi:hypothetical protein